MTGKDSTIAIVTGLCPGNNPRFFQTLSTENNPMTDELKGGELAKRAAILCQNTKFHLYLDRRCRAKFKMDIPDGTHTEQDAKDFILRACGVESRRELDHNQDAAKNFNYVLHHFYKYLRRLNQS